MPRGGYRQPESPAPVSNPGRLSRRTDGGPAQKMRELSGGDYGDRQEFNQLQRGAGLALEATPQQASPAPSGGPSGGGGQQSMPVVPFGEDSNRPDEPLTQGAPFGPGAGPGSIGLGGDAGARKAAEKLRPYLPALEFMANRPDADSDARALVRRIKGALQ